MPTRPNFHHQPAARRPIQTTISEGGRAPLPLEQLEAHARQLAAEHAATARGGPRRELLARLERNAERLEQIYRELSEDGFSEPAETPSEEWLRDNHYVVRAQLLEIRRNLPRKYYEELPTLTSADDGAAIRGSTCLRATSSLIRPADSIRSSLRRFADAYQDVTPLTIGELWAIPIMLRLALVENLCRAGGADVTRAGRSARPRAAFAANLLGVRPTNRGAAETAGRQGVGHVSSSRFSTASAISPWLRRRHGAGCRPD